VEVEVADLALARVAEAVDDHRRHSGEGPGGHRDGLVLDAQPDRKLTVEDVEEVGVPTVHVQVRPLPARAEARPGRVQRIVVGQDLHPPLRRVADDLAPAGWDELHASG
jgi:hypothetical protein